MDINLNKLWETVKDREAWYASQRIRHDLVPKQQKHLLCNYSMPGFLGTLHTYILIPIIITVL